MNTRAAGRGTTTAGIAATTDAVTTVAAAGERGRQGTTRGVIYQPGSTLTKSATFPENRTTSVSRSLTGSSTVPVHREGGSRQRMSGPSTMSHPALWTCPACGRPLTVALNPEGGEAGAHRPLEISRASAAAHACAPAARFPQFHSASSSITGYEPASCQPWQPPVSAGAEDDEGVLSQSASSGICGQVAKCVIQSDFQCPGGAEPIRPFGDHSGLSVEAFDNATGELPPGSEPVQNQVAVRAQPCGQPPSSGRAASASSGCTSGRGTAPPSTATRSPTAIESPP